MRIHELIIGTIQGEGSNTGMPCDFVRLHGCNVGCWFCDTGYSKENLNGSTIPFEELSFTQISRKLKSYNIVISGGEPMLAKDLVKFCEHLIKRGKRVFIETSGTAWKQLPPEVWITLSPKDNVSKLKTKKEAWQEADEVKFIVSCKSPMESLKGYEEILYQLRQDIYFQPEASEYFSKSPIDATMFSTADISNLVELVHRIPNSKISLQTHKILNLP